MNVLNHTLTAPPVLLLIVGKSGAGKTTMTQIMEENGIPSIVSYTTRPMRDGETNGKEHWFVTPEDKPQESQMMAYTKFGNYEYWTTFDQVKKSMCTYVIDEDGVRFFKEKIGNRFFFFTIYLDRDAEDIKNDIDEERADRDKDRKKIPLTDYDFIIHNYYSMEDFREKIKELSKSLLME